MYKTIRAHKTTRERYANQLAAEGVIADGDAKKMADDHRDKLDAGEVTTELAEVQPDEFTIDWSKYLAGKLSDPVDTTVKRATLDKLAKAINTIPDGVELHPRLAKSYGDRRKRVAGEQPGEVGRATCGASGGLSVKISWDAV